MIISRTPFRISFLGGGTDYPGWYREHGGAVIATTIDKYCYLTCRYLPPFFEHRYHIVYSRIENPQRLEDIAHPAVQEILKFLGVRRGLEIHNVADLPARSGMGSSSAFTVGLLHALYALQGKMVSKHKLSMDGIHVEQNLLRETVGSQDQVMAAYGGLNHVRFLADGEISVRPVVMRPERILELQSHVMLFYTGIIRTASEVASTYVKAIDKQRRQLRIINDLVKEGLSILAGDRDIASFGELLHEAWQVKRNLSQSVSNPQIDDIYGDAVSAGAVGGKLLGAGGGGFMLLFVPPERHECVRQKLQGLIHVPCNFESQGSQIIFFDPERDYSNEEQLRVNSQVTPFRELSRIPAPS